jgi:hypothetical protein
MPQMKKGYYLTILGLLVCSMVWTAGAQDQATQTVYVHEGDINGTLLAGVQVTGQDAAGNNFQGTTDFNGAVVLSGQPGTWQFSFYKDGYDPLSLNYDVIQSGIGGVYLQKSLPSQSNQIAWTVYVHEGDINGTLLAGVQVTGQDAAGNNFQGTTDLNGAVVLSGQPGTWQFSFYKDGYDPLSLNYDVTESGEGAVYLQSSGNVMQGN